MKRTAIIMAGGSGERFWPLSRKNKPKQLLPLGNSERSMIYEAVDRIKSVIDPNDVYVITGEHLVLPIRDELDIIPAENIIPEPHKRNTAPAIALACSFIIAKYSRQGIPKQEISTAILTADHIMQPIEGFLKTVNTAMEFVEYDEVISTIGIPPTRPETGYGYLKISNKLKEEDPKIYELDTFKEKPDLETAKKYLEDGNYLWNSGMFFWRLDTFCEQISKHLPDVGNKIEEMSKLIEEGELTEILNIRLETIADIFEIMPNISIDFGLMEKADRIVATKANFNWDDIGDLCSVERTKSSDDDGNIILGNSLQIDSKNTIFINDSKKKILAGIGLDDLVIAVTSDAVLVSKKSDVQNVKRIVNMLKENDEGYL